MSLVIMFHFPSSMFNMFRTLIHPSSGACDFSIESPHWSCVLVLMCVGVSVWLGWVGIAIRIPRHIKFVPANLYKFRPCARYGGK